MRRELFVLTFAAFGATVLAGCSGGERPSPAGAQASIADGGGGLPDGSVVGDGGFPDGGAVDGGGPKDAGMAGTTRWIRTLAPPFTSVSSNAEGDAVASAVGLLLAWDENGAALWTRDGTGPNSLDVTGDLSISPATEEIFATGFRNVSGGGNSRLRFAPNGTSMTVLQESTDSVSYVGPMAFGGSGRRAYAWVSWRGGYNLFVTAAGGAQLWSLGTDPNGSTDPNVLGFSIDAYAFDPGSSLFVAGVVGHPFTFGGHTWAKGAVVVFKLDAETGTFVWGESLSPATGSVSGLGTTALGTVVVAGTFSGAFQFAGSTLSSDGDAAGFLLAIDAGGTERWARQMKVTPGGARPDLWSPRLAVDASGEAAFVSTDFGACPSAHAVIYNLAGDLLWERTLVTTGCTGGVRISGAVFAGHELLLSGVFQGAVDFGQGPVTSAGTDGDGVVLRFRGRAP